MSFGRLRYAAYAIILCTFAAGLSGCALVEEAQKLVPETEMTFEETTLVVSEDGTWTEALIERMDQPYYDTTELKNLVDETVKAYNAQAGDLAVTTDEFTVGENGVTLKMTYKDAAAYAGYNQVAAFEGSMLQAQMEGFLFLNDFRKVADGVTGSDVMSNEEPLSHKEYQVLVTDLTHKVIMPEKVKYVSANAAVADWKTVSPAAQAQESAPADGLVLPSSAVYVGQADNTKVSEAEREKGYLYIIYE